jgi:putative transposase
MFELLALVLAVLRAGLRSRADLLAENLLRHQLAVLTRPTRERLTVRTRRLCRECRRHRVLVRPEAVAGWHRRGWRLFWWWRSRCPLGRPRPSAEVRDLIGTIARDNPLCA